MSYKSFLRLYLQDFIVLWESIVGWNLHLLRCRPILAFRKKLFLSGESLPSDFDFEVYTYLSTEQNSMEVDDYHFKCAGKKAGPFLTLPFSRRIL
jgi:hypothetical protein